MDYINRQIEEYLRHSLERNKSVLLLGPRQTGKTTLLDHLHKDRMISLVKPSMRQRYEKDSSLLEKEIESLPTSNKKLPTICLDEIQKVPALFDSLQDLIDRRKAKFVLTGSSARKLRRGPSVNLLPGRVVSLHLDPLSLVEAPAISLENRLLFGELPGIFGTKATEDKEADLRSYVTTYLEEEVRAEAIVRNLASFARFLELAASESGKTVNFSKLSQEIGVAHTTIMSYYEILEDCLIVEGVDPWTQSKTRKKLTKARKYMFFDSGVRRAAAGEPPALVLSRAGDLFEEWVGLQLIRLARNTVPAARVHFWRDPDGPEVDWVIHRGEELIPIEVKWSEAPSARDIKHLVVFMREYPTAGKGYVVCRTPQRFRLSPAIEAIPWEDIPELFKSTG
jgi:predicted AAA+ superfamily ATPase